ERKPILFDHRFQTGINTDGDERRTRHLRRGAHHDDSDGEDDARTQRPHERTEQLKRAAANLATFSLGVILALFTFDARDAHDPTSVLGRATPLDTMGIGVVGGDCMRLGASSSSSRLEMTYR